MLTLLLTSMLTLAFNIKPVRASGTIYIRADGSIDPPTAPITTTDNVTYVLTDNLNDSVVVERNNIVVDGAGYTVAGSGSGITLTSRTNVTIENTTINYGNTGIELASSSNNTLSGNNVANDNIGIELDYSSGNTLSGNNVTNNSLGIGIELSSSSGNTLSGNNVAHSSQGIELDSSIGNTLSGNNIAGIDYGIGLYYSYTNTLSGNNVTANNYDGIYLDYSFGNTLSGNNVTNNGHGIDLYDSFGNTLSGNNVTNNGYGIWLSYSSDNSIFHNDFVGNSVQVLSDNSSNTWDDGYPSGGNYWSDYNGTDLYGGPFQNIPGSDGIGDTPYVIDGNNRDNYPLMKPYPWAAHDVGITSVAAYKNVVGKGFSVFVNMMMFNYGNDTETDNVTIYANQTVISEIYDIELTSRNFTVIPLTWNTTGFAYGNYTISAYAWPVSGETDTADNNCTCSVPVHVGVPGDVSGTTPGVYDGITNMKDIAYLVSLFQAKPNKPNWNPNADVNNDGVVDMKDIAIAVYYFNQHE